MADDVNERRGPSGKAEDIPAGKSASRTRRPRLFPLVLGPESTALEDLRRMRAHVEADDGVRPGLFCEDCRRARADCVCTWGPSPHRARPHEADPPIEG